ncbi:MAG: hypothetical protein KGQ41_00830 [Alphaproteobacteria bacterium]|nr:hypothetical protein [Alphaproteobacteria bacterium]
MNVSNAITSQDLQPLPGGNGTLATDVRRLILQAEQGRTFDTEHTGHAYDVLEAVLAELDLRLGTGTALAAELERKLEHFARSAASSAMYLRLVISDTMPELPDYEPCQISVYDGLQSTGTDFSKVIQRSTIYGTLMTSVNITDLKAYFESGRKRRLLVYMGTDRRSDMKALDSLLLRLPAILEGAGFSKTEIAEMIKAIRAGEAPPMVMKALHQMAEAAQLRGTIAATQNAPAAIKAQLHRLEAQIRQLVARIAASPALPSIFRVMLRAPLLLTSRTTPARSPVAGNDNRPAPIKALKTLALGIRQAARERTAFTPTQRREMAAILRDVRAILKKSTRAAPMHGAVAALTARVSTLATQAQTLPPVFADKILPAAASIVIAAAPPAQYHAIIKPLLQKALHAVPSAIALPALAQMTRILENPKGQEILARAVVRQPLAVAATQRETLQAIARTQIPHGEAPQGHPKAPSDVPKRNADGSLMDCCKPKFAAASNTATQAGAVTTAAATSKADGSIHFTDSSGKIVGTASRLEVDANIKGHAALDRELAAIAPKAQESTRWEADTRALLDALNTTTTNSFNHVCGPNCNHLPHGTVTVQDTAELKVIAIEPEASVPHRPKRTYRPS